jgi:GTP-binding protein HflX
LDEVRESDVLVHVLDISHSNFEDHYQVVNKTLAEIDKEDKPTIVVFNKIDAYKDVSDNDEKMSIDDLKKTWMAKLNDTKCVFISATNKENIEDFKEILYEEVKSIFQVRYPYHNFLY